MTEVLKAEEMLQKLASSKKDGTVKSRRKKSSKKLDNSSESDDDGTFVQMRGRIVSGRVWKTQKKRASSAIKTAGLRQSFAQKQKFREELKRVKELSRTIEHDRLQAKLDKKQRREDNLKRAEENRKKNEVVQVIKNSAKIKKMRKTQLRLIEKRDVTEIK